MLQKRVIGIVLAVVFYIGLTVGLATSFGNNASIIVSAMASVALVIVTAALVYATLAYTEAAQMQAAALTDPVVFFGVEEVAMTDQFFVQNVGPGIAYDVSFKVLKDFEAAVLVADPGSADEKLSDLAFLESTLKTLGPGQKMPFAIINPLHNKNMSKETIEVEVSYKNNMDAKKSFQQRFPIDFAYYKGLREVRETTADHIRRIAGSIQEIEKKLEKK
jgi:hypothetical protein